MSKDIVTFDYNALAPSEAQEVRAAAERIRLRMKRTVEDIIAIGHDLAAVKDRLGHGGFLPWIEAEFDMSRDTAQNFMRVAAVYGKNGIIPNLPPTALYELAAPSTPSDVREAVEKKVEAGEKVTTDEIKKLKREKAEVGRIAEQQRKRAETLAAEADGLRSRVDALIRGQAAERALAREEAEKTLSADLEALRSKLAEAERESSGLRDKAEQERASLEYEIERREMEVREKYEAAADDMAKAALGKLTGEIEGLRRQATSKRQEIERLDANFAEVRKRLGEQREYLNSLKGVDFEASGLLKEAEEVIRQITLFMVSVEGLEHKDEHPDKLRNTIWQLGGIARRTAETLDGMYESKRPALKVIDA